MSWLFMGYRGIRWLGKRKGSRVLFALSPVGNVGNVATFPCKAGKGSDFIHSACRMLSIALVFLALPFHSSSALPSPVVIPAGEGTWWIGERVEYLEDKSDALTIDGIRSGAHDAAFIPHHNQVVNLSFRDHPVWFRARTANAASEKRELVFRSGLNFNMVELWLFPDAGPSQYSRDGLWLPRKERSMTHHYLVNRFELGPGQSGDLYIRVQTAIPVVFSPALFTLGAFHEQTAWEMTWFGVIGGVFLVTILYNFFLFLAMRERVYLYFILYMACAALVSFSINGVNNAYLWPDTHWWKIRVNIQLSYLLMLSALLYTRHFLDTRKNTPRIDKTITAFSVVILANMAIGEALEVRAADEILMALAGIYLFFPFVAGIQSYRKGLRAARWFLAANGAAFIGLTLHLVVTTLAIPFARNPFHFFELGYALEAVLLSLALADRINILRDEKEVAERETLRVASEARDTLEEKVAAQTLQLREAAKLKDKFIAIISHDLKSPVLSLATILRDMEGAADNGSRKGVGMALTYCEQMNHSISRILDISRLQSGSLNLFKEPVAARDLCGEAFKSVTPIADAKGVRLSNDIGPEARIHADRDLLLTVAANLVSNAVKFSGNGGTVAVAMTREEQTGDATLAVRDTGTGIPEEMRENLFRHEVRTTTFGTAGEKGSGLGLPLCHDIVRAHGGRIWFESVAGGGTTFFVALPGDPAQAAVPVNG